VYLGICKTTGLIYEGLNSADIPSIPLPCLTQAKLIVTDADWKDLPRGLSLDPLRWLFREDSFDPVTRTRRGRLFEPQPGQAQPIHHGVAPHPYEDPMMRQVGAGGRVSKAIFTFTACNPLLTMVNKGQGMTLALGTSKAVSPWRIIQTEALANGLVMVTLKSLSAFAIIPTVDYGQIAIEHRPAIADAIERVLNSAFREAPISVIDHCRAALTVLLARWLVQTGNEKEDALVLDLGHLANKCESNKMTCVANVARIIARMHSRGKPNEQLARKLRQPTNGDDEFAIESVGLVLREFGWSLQ
jgi:hypothetical protein